MKHIIKCYLYLLIASLFIHTSLFAETAKQKLDSHEVTEVGKFLGAKDATHPVWFKDSFLDLEEDIAEATENNKRLVVYFWQPGCPYCDQLWSDNFEQQSVVDEFRNNFDIVALNMWGDREIVNVGGNEYSEKTFAEALGIKYTPTLLFFDENKKVIHQLNGYVPVDNFQRSMSFVSGKFEKETSFSEYSKKDSISASKKVSKRGLNKQAFFIPASINLVKKENDLLDKKYTLVFFEEEHCDNCDLLHQKTLKDPATLALAQQFNAVQLDRNSQIKVITPKGKETSADQWASALGIEYLPAMVFFDEEGSQVMRIDTQLRTFHVQSVFDYVLSGSYQKEANFQRYISARADEIRETGKDVDIFAY